MGVVQGLGEFLPISSSAHLAILPWFAGFKDPGLTFSVALHFGTLVAIVAYFWRDYWELFFGFYRHNFVKTKSDEKSALQASLQARQLYYLVLATIPAACAGYFLDDLAESYFRSPLLIAINMSAMGVVLLTAEWAAGQKKSLENISLSAALLIGFAQVLALMPGVSRSGVTITAGLFWGLNRFDAARFSFLMAVPITFGAFVFKVPQILQTSLDGPFWVGVFTSAIIGYLSIKYLLQYIKTHSYRVFVYYRFIFTAVVLFHLMDN